MRTTHSQINIQKNLVEERMYFYTSLGRVHAESMRSHNSNQTYKESSSVKTAHERHLEESKKKSQLKQQRKENYKQRYGHRHAHYGIEPTDTEKADAKTKEQTRERVGYLKRNGVVINPAVKEEHKVGVWRKGGAYDDKQQSSGMY